MKKHWRLEGLEVGGLCLASHEVLTACGRVVDETHGTRDYFRLSCQTCKTSRIARRGIVRKTLVRRLIRSVEAESLKKEIYDLMAEGVDLPFGCGPVECSPEKTFTAGRMTYTGPAK